MTKQTTKQTTKFDIWHNGKSHSVRLAPAVWRAFVAMANANGHALSGEAYIARRAHNGTLAEAINAHVLKHSTEPLYLHSTREAWLGAIIDAMRVEFTHRGYPLPEKITAVMGFPSTGWRGKRRGEYWPMSQSAKGWSEIFIHPCETDVTKIVNILTHELCHAADDHASDHGKAYKIPKGGHGKTFQHIGLAMDMEGKPKHMLGGDAWLLWAQPIIDAAGPMPFASLAEFVKQPAKQAARMLKFEHAECPDMDYAPYIWRAAGKATADKPKVSCPCCGERVANPHFGEDDEPDEVPEDQQ